MNVIPSLFALAPDLAHHYRLSSHHYHINHFANLFHCSLSFISLSLFAVLINLICCAFRFRAAVNRHCAPFYSCHCTSAVWLHLHGGHVWHWLGSWRPVLNGDTKPSKTNRICFICLRGPCRHCKRFPCWHWKKSKVCTHFTCLIHFITVVFVVSSGHFSPRTVSALCHYSPIKVSFWKSCKRKKSKTAERRSCFLLFWIT